MPTDLDEWRHALGEGMRAAGHSRRVPQLLDGTSVDVRFAHYGDLFPGRESQETEASEEGAELAQMLLDAVDARLDEPREDREAQVLRRARNQLAPDGEAQGAGDVLRRVVAAGNTLLALPGLRTVGGWTSGGLMVHRLRQVRQAPSVSRIPAHPCLPQASIPRTSMPPRLSRRSRCVIGILP